MLVGVVQLDLEEKPQKNFSKLDKYVQYAQNHSVDLIVFPELLERGYYLSEYNVSGTKLAQTGHSKLLSNSPTTVIWGGAQYDNGKVFNVVYKNDYYPVYRKNHLFLGEERVFTAGTEKSKLFYNGQIASLICFDLRYPEYFRQYLPHMPLAFTVSSAWPLSRIVHWENLLVSRAIENQCFIFASNRVGTDQDFHFGGTSMIISPNGEIISKASVDREELLLAEIDLTIASSLRDSFPVLPNSPVILPKY